MSAETVISSFYYLVRAYLRFLDIGFYNFFVVTDLVGVLLVVKGGRTYIKVVFIDINIIIFYEL